MYIKRAIEEIILKNYNNSKALAITGARQIGKTTTTKYLFPNIKRINMKDNKLLTMALDNPGSFLSSFDKPLFIDEIQDAPFLLNEVKVILDEVGGKGNYIFSGSRRWQLMKGLSESLAGMVSIVEMANLSMREICNVNINMPFCLSEDYINKRKKCIKKYDDIWFYIHKGFYPELYENIDRDYIEYYRGYVTTYIEKDIYDIIKIKDSTLFYRFLVSVAARTGNVLNYSNIASDISVDSETVKTWVAVLEQTGIVYLLKPYYNLHLIRAVKSPKIYFRDTGLAAYLTNWTTKEQLRDGAMSGAFFETFVINEIIKSYINAGKDYKAHIYYYRGKDKVNESGEKVEKEIDLIIEENNTLYPIEIKKNASVNEKMAKSFSALKKDISKKYGIGAIIGTLDSKMQLNENLIALPIEYI